MKILLTQELATKAHFSFEESIRFAKEEPGIAAELIVDFQIHQVQEDRFRLEGQLEGTVQTQCDRCCKELELAVSHDFTYSLRLDEEPAQASEYNCTEDDCETMFLHEPAVESEDIIREQLLLAMPGFSLCGRDCKGLCDRCGINLNIKSCKCGEVNENSPFAILKDIQNN
jgi:uncharacterized protein